MNTFVLRRADLQRLWSALTGDELVLIRVVDQAASYWGRVGEDPAWRTVAVVEIRRDLLDQPEALLRTFLREAAYHIADDRARRRPLVKPRQRVHTLRADIEWRERAAILHGMQLLRTYTANLADRGLTWRDVSIDLGGDDTR